MPVDVPRHVQVESPGRMSPPAAGKSTELTVWAAKCLTDLLPAACCTACVAIVTPPIPLPPEEWLAVKHAGPKRQAEFAAGRTAARSALSALGVDKAIIPVAPDRSPCWPPGVVGSLAHAHGIALAAVANAGAVHSIGIDIEKIAAVEPSLWAEFLSAAERAFLDQLPPSLRQQAAASIFATKEAFFKFQYPMTRRWLDFRDARALPDLERFTCKIESNHPIAIGQTAVSHFESRLALHHDLVISAIALPKQPV